MLKSKAILNEETQVKAIQCHEEAHQNRIKNLRKELDYIKSTEWKYQPVEKLFGHN